jgi:cyanate permease
MIERGVEYAAEVEEVEFTLRQAMRTRAYWLLIAGHAGYNIVMPIIFVHFIPFLTDIGIDPVRAAVMMGTLSTISIPIRAVGGFMTDRAKRGQLRFLMGGAYFLQAVGLTIFLLNQTIPMIYVWLVLYFAARGISVPLYSLMRARYFGRKAFGSIQGTLLRTKGFRFHSGKLHDVHDTVRSSSPYLCRLGI